MVCVKWALGPNNIASPFTVRLPSVFTPDPPNVSPSGLSVLTPLATFKSATVVIPVKEGLSMFAFKLRAFCVAVLTILAASLVLSTFASWTCAFVIPVTVPEKAGLFLFALLLRSVCTVVKKSESLFRAVASFSKLLRISGASPCTASIVSRTSMVLLPLRIQILFATMSLLLFKLSGIFKLPYGKKKTSRRLGSRCPVSPKFGPSEGRCECDLVCGQRACLLLC